MDEFRKTEPPQRLLFTAVRLPYGWLGNMAPYPLAFALGTAEQRWPTSEHLFQAMRFLTSFDIVDKIRNTVSPMGAKMMAKRHASAMCVVPRSPEDIANMERVLRLKVEQHRMQEMLRETGDLIITENVSARRSESGLFWGAAMNAAGEWVGQNKLGELWMKLRSEL